MVVSALFDFWRQPFIYQCTRFSSLTRHLSPTHLTNAPPCSSTLGTLSYNTTMLPGCVRCMQQSASKQQVRSSAGSGRVREQRVRWGSGRSERHESGNQKRSAAAQAAARHGARVVNWGPGCPTRHVGGQARQGQCWPQPELSDGLWWSGWVGGVRDTQAKRCLVSHAEMRKKGRKNGTDWIVCGKSAEFVNDAEKGAGALLKRPRGLLGGRTPPPPAPWGRPARAPWCMWMKGPAPGWCLSQSGPCKACLVR